MAKDWNRSDIKWAHPEAAEEGWYTVTMGDIKETAKLSREELLAENEPIGELMCATLKESEEEAYQNVEWKEYYTEGGCVEEPDAKPVRVLVGIPKDIKEGEKLPLYFNFNAGILCFARSYAEMCLSLARPMMYSAIKRFIHISYDCSRCTPEYQYPASTNDAHAAYQWVLDHAEELHIDTDKIVWSGVSSSAHTALCMAFRMKRYNWGNAPMPRGLVLMVPVLDDLAFNQSQQFHITNDDGSKAGWDGEQNRFSLKLWLGDRFGEPSLLPEAVPGRATLEDVKGLPPIWIPVEAEFDPGRDTAYRLVSLLHEAGVFCDLHVWGGNTHHITSACETDFGKRVRQIIVGAYRDAVTFDFRRPWLEK